MGRGKGVKAQYNKFSNLRSCVEAGGQASKNSCIKEVIEDQLQTELGYEVRGIRLLLIFLRGRRDEALGATCLVNIFVRSRAYQKILVLRHRT